MDPRSLQYVAEACGGELSGDDGSVEVRRVCADSRAVEEGDLFVAISGERHDGHDFLEEAARRGAFGALAERGRLAKAPKGVRGLIRVDCSRAALGRLAARYRSDFDLTAVAIAGSNGKTTVKDAAAAVLAERLSVLKSRASFNNDLGVPFSLMRIESGHEAGVFEAGSNHPGELAPLLAMIRPRIGVLTSIGPEHLEFFGDLDGVALEEGEIGRALPSDGRLFVNGDAPRIEGIVERTAAPVVRVGAGPGNDWRVSGPRPLPNGVEFDLEAPDARWSGRYRVPLHGKHQAVNAALAIALGAELGLSRDEIAAGLMNCEAPPGRLRVSEIRGFTLLDDSYNANLDSMRAALETLRDFPGTNRRIAILGEMAELGASSREAHLEAGRAAAKLGVAELWAVGPAGRWLAEGFGDPGLDRVHCVETAFEAGEALRNRLAPGDVLLVKGSRAARMERAIEELRKEACFTT